MDYQWLFKKSFSVGKVKWRPQRREHIGSSALVIFADSIQLLVLFDNPFQLVEYFHLRSSTTLTYGILDVLTYLLPRSKSTKMLLQAFYGVEIHTYCFQLARFEKFPFCKLCLISLFDWLRHNEFFLKGWDIISTRDKWCLKTSRPCKHLLYCN